VAVDVKGGADLGMTDAAADGQNVHARAYQHTDMRMSQGVKRHPGQLPGVAYPPLIAAQIIRRQHLPFNAAENERGLTSLP
jgi:hypothetical protein